MKDNLKEIVYFLINNGIATKEEINLVTNINGYTAKTLNDILYTRTGYRNIEQLMDEEY